MMNSRVNRRRVLRGVLNGVAVGVALPLLDVFLTPNGDAIAGEAHAGGPEAAGKSKLPLCFGSWFWPLGLEPGFWEPKQVGKNFELNEHLRSLAPIKGKFNIISGTEVYLDGKTLQVHYSPPQGIATGEISATGSGYGQSFDQIIAAQVGKQTRFRSISMACDGNARATWSSRGSNAGMNPAEISPLALYTRLFGPGFADPNAAEFHPDPAILVRKSALSAVTEDRQRLMKRVSASDRERLDAYFTSLRDLEQQFALELQKPEPLEACTLPEKPTDTVSTDIRDVARTHKAFAKLTAHALACGQTRVFNTVVSLGLTAVHMPGDPSSNHSHTHEEPIDPKLGYQVKCKWFADQYLAMFAELVNELDGIKEGGGTLLDRVVLFGFTDHGEARKHSPTKIPLLIAGRAGGRLANGIHVNAEGNTSCRAGLTCMQAMGLPVGTWGTQSNQTSKPFSELLI
jgi:hypothetical protein